MDDYNVKIIHYDSETQIKVYTNPIKSNKLDKLKKVRDKADFEEYAKMQFSFEYGSYIGKTLQNRIETDDIETDYKTEFYSYFDTYLEDLLCDYLKIQKLNDEIEEMHCIEKEKKSIKDSRSRAIQNIYHLGKSNKWQWFITLTFNPDIVNSLDYTECTKQLSNWLSNMKKINPSMLYIGVPELHEGGRYHFHFLMTNIDNMKMVDSGKVSYKGKAYNKEDVPQGQGKTIYNMQRYKYGFSTATKVEDSNKSVGYLCKYITKEIVLTVPKGKKKYWATRNLEKAEENTMLLTHNQLEDYLKYIEKNNPDFQKEIKVDTVEYKQNIKLYEFKTDNYNKMQL
jgi:hypothetical protein